MDSSRDAVGRMRECGNLGCHRLDSLWTRTNHPARRIEIDVSGGRLELARDQSQQRSFAAPFGPTTPVHPVARVSVTSLRVETESVYEKERPESRTNMIAAPQKCSRAEKIARAVVRRHERWSSYFRTPSISPVLDVVENIRALGANQPISGCLKVCGCSATGAVEDSKGRRSRLVRPA